MARIVILAYLVLTAGCVRDHSAQVIFPDWAHALAEADSQVSTESRQQQQQRITLVSGPKLTVAAFVADISQQSGVSVVVAQDLDAKTVAVDFVDTPVDQALAVVARRLDAQMIQVGNIFYLGELRAEDRAILVRSVVRLDADQVDAAANSLISDFGRVVTADGGLLIVSDRIEVIQRLHGMLDQIEQTPYRAWSVQCYMVVLSDRDARQLGFDPVQVGSLSASIGRAVKRSAEGRWAASVGFESVIRAEMSQSQSRTVIAPSIVVAEGQTGRWQSGQTTPVPRRVVTDSGAIETVSFDSIESGAVLTASVRSLGHSRAMLTVDLDLSAVVGDVEGAPILSRDRANFEAPVTVGAAHLLGSMEITTTTQGAAGLLFPSLRRQSGDDRRIYLWARVSSW